MGNTPVASIVFFVVAALFGALGQILYKHAATVDGGLVARTVGNPAFIAGVACYFVVMTLFVAAYRRGGELSVLYPIYSSTFAFGAVLSYALYGSPIKLVHVCGMALLVGGMALMGR